MIRFLTREVAGWLLVLLGLFGFYVCFVFLTAGRLFESGCMTFISVMVFRGGIHLVKVAVAARICMDAHERLKEETPPRAAVAAPPARPGRRPVIVSRTK